MIKKNIMRTLMLASFGFLMSQSQIFGSTGTAAGSPCYSPGSSELENATTAYVYNNTGYTIGLQPINSGSSTCGSTNAIALNPGYWMAFPASSYDALESINAMLLDSSTTTYANSNIYSVSSPTLTTIKPLSSGDTTVTVSGSPSYFFVNIPDFGSPEATLNQTTLSIDGYLNTSSLTTDNAVVIYNNTGEDIALQFGIVPTQDPNTYYIPNDTYFTYTTTGNLTASGLTGGLTITCGNTSLTLGKTTSNSFVTNNNSPALAFCDYTCTMNGSNLVVTPGPLSPSTTLTQTSPGITTPPTTSESSSTSSSGTSSPLPGTASKEEQAAAIKHHAAKGF